MQQSYIQLFLKIWHCVAFLVLQQAVVVSIKCKGNSMKLIEGVCFKLIDTSLTYSQAVVSCENQGFSIATFYDMDFAAVALRIIGESGTVSGGELQPWANFLYPRTDGLCSTIKRGQFFEAVSCTDKHQSLCISSERTTYEAAGTMMCRCQTWECDGAGGCLGESPDCQRHWFGEGCQYRNLAEYADVDTVLLDGDSYTCFEYRGVFDINLSVKIYFTWMRIVTTSRDLTKKNYTLVLTNREVGSEPQDNHPRFNVTGGTIDVQGTTAAYIDGISLTLGDRLEVCELYIGGGRNVAFAQPTEDSKISNDTSFLAVDGHDQRTSDCYRGQLNSEQFWLVDFRSPCIVHEIVIKRRFVSSKDYSHMFGTVIHLYNVSGEPVVLERQFDDSISSIVRIFTKITFPITRIKLTLTSSNTRTYLEICELEAYGECEPQPKTTSSIIQSSSNPNVSSHLLESNFSASPISDVELPLGRRDYPYIICVVFLVVCVMTYIIGTYLSHVEKEFKVIGKKKMSEAYSSEPAMFPTLDDNDQDDDDIAHAPPIYLTDTKRRSVIQKHSRVNDVPSATSVTSEDEKRTEESGKQHSREDGSQHHTEEAGSNHSHRPVA